MKKKFSMSGSPQRDARRTPKILSESKANQHFTPKFDNANPFNYIKKDLIQEEKAPSEIELISHPRPDNNPNERAELSTPKIQQNEESTDEGILDLERKLTKNNNSKAIYM